MDYKEQAEEIVEIARELDRKWNELKSEHFTRIDELGATTEHGTFSGSDLFSDVVCQTNLLALDNCKHVSLEDLKNLNTEYNKIFLIKEKKDEIEKITEKIEALEKSKIGEEVKSD